MLNDNTIFVRPNAFFERGQFLTSLFFGSTLTSIGNNILFLLMISIQTHSNQINLLNDYIKALEKQISGSKAENQKIQKNYQQNSNYLSALTTDINRAKNQIAQLKKQNIRLNQRLKPLISLQKQHSDLQQKVRMGGEEKARASGQLKKMIEIIKNQQGRIKDKDNQISQKNNAYRQKVQEIQKLQSIIKTTNQQSLNQKKKLQASLRQTQKIVSEKDSLLQKLEKQLDMITKQFQTQNNNLHNQSSRITNELSTKLELETKQKESMLQKFESIKLSQKQLQNKVVDQEEQIQYLTNRLMEAQQNIKTKGKAYQDVLVRSGEQKRSYEGAIRKLTVQKQELILRNSNSQGNLSQNSKALAQAFKQNQDLSKRITSLQLQLQQKNLSVRQLSDQINKLNAQLQDIVFNFQSTNQENTALSSAKQSNEEFITILQNAIEGASQQINRKKNALLLLQNEVKDLKRDLKEKEKVIDSKDEILLQKQKIAKKLREELIQLEAAMLDLSTQKEGIQKLLRAVQQKNKSLSLQLNEISMSLNKNLSEKESIQNRINQSDILIEGLQTKVQTLAAKLNTSKNTLDTTTNSYSVFKKKAQKDIEELGVKLSESIKNNEKKQAKIKQLSYELKDIEEDLNKRLKNTNLSARQQIDQIKSKFQKKITELNLQKNNSLQKKDQQLKFIKDNSKKELEEQKDRLRQMIQDNKRKEIQYQKMKLDLQNEIFGLKQQIKKISLQSALSSQTKQHQQEVMYNLKSVAEELQNYIKQQKAHISQLLEHLSQKNKQQEMLQDSNQTLRKQILHFMKNEDELRKQLLQLKLKASSNSSMGNRNSSVNLRLGDIDKQYKSTYIQKGKNARFSGIHEQRRSKDYNKYLKAKEQQDSITKGLFFKESTVNDMNNSDVQEEAVFDQILRQEIQNSKQ